MERHYRRGEKGLETLEKIYIDSKRMERLLNKLTQHYHVEFKKPAFRPVFFSKRIGRKTWGLFWGSRIDIAYCLKGTKDARKTLWHEVLHSLIKDNVHLLNNVPNKSTNSTYTLTREVFRLGEGDGSHDSWRFKATCQCGFWIKSNKYKHSFFCNHCKKTNISQTEYTKLQKIAKLKSRIAHVDINRYQIWKNNKKLGRI